MRRVSVIVNNGIPFPSEPSLLSMIQILGTHHTPALYRDLADSVQSLIEQGTLRPGHRVPSVRRMALQRDVSISTVLQAYTLLESKGFLEARPQSGYYVRPRLPSQIPEPRTARPMAKPSYIGANDLLSEVLANAGNTDFVPLGAACPSPSLFPNKKLARFIGAACRNDPAIIGRYSMAGAYEPLAREIARRYLQAGAPVVHDEIVVTIGCCEALMLCLRAITKPGDTVALETPAYFGFIQTLKSLGLKALEVPTDPHDGIELDALRRALAGNEVKAVIVMPSFQNPLGSCMPDEKKEKLYRLLGEFDVPAIEDDIYGDLHFDERRPKPLKAWDTEGRVLLCSSFSKTLAPSLRVGWCVPGRYLERVRLLKFTQTISTPIVLQKAIADFLRTGGYDHHLRGIRRAYQNQLGLFGQAILRYFPEGTRLSRPKGGFLLWVELPSRIKALLLYRKALSQGIIIAPGPLFSVKDRYQNCIRLNCGLPWDDSLDGTLSRLGALASLHEVAS
jgi:DNA-binding transcriptional MocR family regulator